MMPRQVRKQSKPTATSQAATPPLPNPQAKQSKPTATPRPNPKTKQSKPTATPQSNPQAKQSKPTAIPRPNPQARSRRSAPVNGTITINYKALKRSELQHHCKELGLRATGKNAELVERLQGYHVKPQLEIPSVIEETAEKTEEVHQLSETPLTVPRPGLLQKVKSEPVEEDRDLVEGWCVVHGMALYRPSTSWAPLVLQRGLVYVQDGENFVPFQLCPLNIPIPDGLLDNHICGECVLRNQENRRKVGHQTCPQDFLNSKFMFKYNMLKYSTSHPSAIPSSASKIRERITQSRKSYQPQEDEAYAQRVDGILFQMRHGELKMDQVLQPHQPLVVHSPAPFNNKNVESG